MPCGIAGSANWNRIRLDRQFWVIPREQIILIYDILFLASWTLTFKKYNLPFNRYNHFEIGWNFSRGRNNISCRNNICFSSFLKRRSTNRVQSFGQRSLWNWVISRVFSRDRVEKCSQVLWLPPFRDMKFFRQRYNCNFVGWALIVSRGAMSETLFSSQKRLACNRIQGNSLVCIHFSNNNNGTRMETLEYKFLPWLTAYFEWKK